MTDSRFGPVELPEITKNFDNKLLSADQRYHILREIKKAAKFPRRFNKQKFDPNNRNSYQNKREWPVPANRIEKVEPQKCLENQLKDAVSGFKRKPKEEQKKLKDGEEVAKVQVPEVKTDKKTKRRKPKLDVVEEIPITDPKENLEETGSQKPKIRKPKLDRLEDDVQVVEKISKKKTARHDRDTGQEDLELLSQISDKPLKGKKRTIELESNEAKQEIGLEDNLKELPAEIEVRKKKKSKHDRVHTVEVLEPLKTIADGKTKRNKQHIEQESKDLPEIQSEENPKRRKPKLDVEKPLEEIPAEIGDKVHKKEKSKHRDEMEVLELATKSPDKKHKKKKRQIEQESIEAEGTSNKIPASLECNGLDHSKKKKSKHDKAALEHHQNEQESSPQDKLKLPTGNGDKPHKRKKQKTSVLETVAPEDLPVKKTKRSKPKPEDKTTLEETNIGSEIKKKNKKKKLET